MKIARHRPRRSMCYISRVPPVCRGQHAGALGIDWASLFCLRVVIGRRALANSPASLSPPPHPQVSNLWPIMPHSAPSVMLLWAVLSSMEFLFLLHHLYRYDRFAVCLALPPRPPSLLIALSQPHSAFDGTLADSPAHSSVS